MYNEKTPLRMTTIDDNHYDEFTDHQQDDQQQQSASSASSSSSKFQKAKKAIFLLLTDVESSSAATFFFFLLIIAICASNILMVMETMGEFQFTPTDCVTCGGNVKYALEDDDDYLIDDNYEYQECTCPPAPLPWLEISLNYLIYFFTAEWTLRVLSFTADGTTGWFRYITSWEIMLDFLAIFPYYLESLPIHSLVTLRFFRLFRIFTLLRLGKYNTMMMTLTNVLSKSWEYLRLLMLILAFGGGLFGSIAYFVERGNWKYYEPTESFEFVRVLPDGSEEISPFSSISSGFWWFLVTATTVGYGDIYPTTPAGQWCAAFAMLTGILVIAFPVSIFSELWHQECHASNGFFDNVVAPPGGITSSTRGFDLTNSSRQNSTRLDTTRSKEIITMDKEDAQLISECIQVIREKQDQLESILSKYQITTADRER